ncbi:Transposable element Tcb2 transposase [Labeo rohita]|uniref:Transposable element Tcb2 transposase n=1 Tax=Labeo rohita TaxID=84645 RepID=A0ABQ8LXR9_LABRO|nr:Transposable element Tcb2 transposase [Labeo rohita]
MHYQGNVWLSRLKNHGKTADLTVVQKSIIDTLHKKEKCTVDRDDRSIERIVKQGRFSNLGELHKEWTEAGVSASRTTTYRRLHDMGYSCRILCVKPLLNQKQCQKRLCWAKEKKYWSVAQWSQVLFSDESKFSISFGNQGPRVWRKNGEAQKSSCLKSSVKFPVSDGLGCHVICWTHSPMSFIKSTVNAAVYQQILEHYMLPAADKLFGDDNFIFQQDLAPAHKAKTTSPFF